MLAEGGENKGRLSGGERFADQLVLLPHQRGLQEEEEVPDHAQLIYPAVAHRPKV